MGRSREGDRPGRGNSRCRGPAVRIHQCRVSSQSTRQKDPSENWGGRLRPEDTGAECLDEVRL